SPAARRRAPRARGCTRRARALPCPHCAPGTAPARTRGAAQGRAGSIRRWHRGGPASRRRRGTRAGQGQGRRARQIVSKRRVSKTARRRAGKLRREQIHELFARLAELDPDPKTELEYSTPFELLVAVVLSAQATDVGVNKATRRLFPVANTPAKLLALGEEGLKRHISSIGLFNSKAR